MNKYKEKFKILRMFITVHKENIDKHKQFFKKEELEITYQLINEGFQALKSIEAEINQHEKSRSEEMGHGDDDPEESEENK